MSSEIRGKGLTDLILRDSERKSPSYLENNLYEDEHNDNPLQFSPMLHVKLVLKAKHTYKGTYL